MTLTLSPILNASSREGQACDTEGDFHTTSDDIEGCTSKLEPQICTKVVIDREGTNLWASFLNDAGKRGSNGYILDCYSRVDNLLAKLKHDTGYANIFLYDGAQRVPAITELVEYCGCRTLTMVVASEEVPAQLAQPFLCQS